MATDGQAELILQRMESGDLQARESERSTEIHKERTTTHEISKQMKSERHTRI